MHRSATAWNIVRAAAALLLAAAAGVYFLRAARPELFRFRTAMEKEHPVLTLGISEPARAAPGGPVAIRNFFINFKTSFPAARAKAIAAAGAVPMITWEPYLTDIRRDALLPDIAAGKYDAYIAAFARRSAGAPLFIRFGHEPNSDWYGWSGKNSSPETYIRAFRRVRGIFLKAANTNCKFVFSINSEDVPDQAWNRFENYYPGDQYADVIGLDAYNWGAGTKTWQKWKNPGKTISPAYERTVKAFPAKPVFLTETASCPAGGDKTRWIGQLLNAAAARFPAVKAVLWFNYSKDCDFTLSSEEMRRAFYGSCGTGRVKCSAGALDWIFKERP